MSTNAKKCIWALVIINAAKLYYGDHDQKKSTDRQRCVGSPALVLEKGNNNLFQAFLKLNPKKKQ